MHYAWVFEKQHEHAPKGTDGATPTAMSQNSPLLHFCQGFCHSGDKSHQGNIRPCLNEEAH